MDIIVQKDAAAWNGSQPVNVRAVLTNVVNQFRRYLEENPLPSVLIVQPGSPLTKFFQQGTDAREINIHAERCDWCRLAYQFAHEFCHLLTPLDTMHTNESNWFVEAVCELASIFALKQMSRSWRTHPPYREWADFSEVIGGYVRNHIDKAEKLPPGKSLKQWLEENEDALKKNSVNRELNHVATHAMYPIFEANPRLWNALQYLPAWGATLKEFLSRWYQHAPEKHQSDIATLAREFGIHLPETPSLA